MNITRKRKIRDEDREETNRIRCEAGGPIGPWPESARREFGWSVTVERIKPNGWRGRQR
jgi:hypothetical protein